MACIPKIEFYRGDTKTFKFEIVDDLDVPVDITGWTFWFTMKIDKDYPDEHAALQKSVTAPADIDSQNGIAYLVLDSTETSEVDPGVYHYDFQRVVDSIPPSVSTFLVGKARVLGDVTFSV